MSFKQTKSPFIGNPLATPPPPPPSVSKIKAINGLLLASIKTINGLALSLVKTINGLSNI